MKFRKRVLSCALAVAMIVSVLAGTGVSAKAANAAKTKSVKVSTQKELEKALADKAVTKVTVSTKSEKTFTVKKGKYNKVDLVVNGEKITLKNSGNFKSIVINNAAKYYEKAKNNTITSKDDYLSLKVSSDAKLKSLKLTKKDAKTAVKVDGELTTLKISAAGSVSLKGNTKKTVTVKNTAKNTKLSTAVDVDVITNSKMGLAFNEGAEKSTVSVSKDNVNVVVKNNTETEIKITDANALTVAVKGGEKADLVSLVAKANSDENKEKDSQEDDSKESASNGGGSFGGGSAYVPSNPTPSTPSYGVADFKEAIETASAGAIASLDENISGNLVATWNESGVLTIDFGTYKVDGSFSLTAPNATLINIIDRLNWGKVTRDFTINAPNAHVQLDVSVGGNINVTQVANSTLVVNDEVTGSVNMNGSGKLNLNKTAKVVVNTEENIKLAGNVQSVDVKNSDAKIEVTSGTKVDSLTVSAEISENKKVEITGAGTVNTVKTQAPVSLGVSAKDVVVESNEAVIEVQSGKTVGTLKANDASVSEIKVAGEGTVAALDVSKAGSSVAVVSDIAIATVVANNGQETTGTAISGVTPITPDVVSYTIKPAADKYSVYRLTNGDGITFDVVKLLPGVGIADVLGQTGYVEVTSSKGLPVSYQYKDRTTVPDWDEAAATAPTATGYYVVRMYTNNGGDTWNSSEFIWFDVTQVQDTISVNYSKTSTKYTFSTNVNGNGEQVPVFTVADGSSIADILGNGKDINFASVQNREIKYMYGDLHGARVVENLTYAQLCSGVSNKLCDYYICAYTEGMKPYEGKTIWFVNESEDEIIITVTPDEDKFSYGVGYQGRYWFNLEDGVTFADLMSSGNITITSKLGGTLKYNYSIESLDNDIVANTLPPAVPGEYAVRVSTDNSDTFYGAYKQFFITVPKKRDSISISVTPDSSFAYTIETNGDGLQFKNIIPNTGVTFESLVNSRNISYSSSNLLTVMTEYKVRNVGDWDSAQAGYPTEPGYYVVRLYTESTDSVEGTSEYIWFDIPSTDQDWVSFSVLQNDESKFTIEDVTAGDGSEYKLIKLKGSTTLSDLMGTYLAFVSSNGLQITLKYTDRENDDAAWEENYPTSAGSYSVWAVSQGTDTCAGGNAFVWFDIPE